MDIINSAALYSGRIVIAGEAKPRVIPSGQSDTRNISAKKRLLLPTSQRVLWTPGSQ
jgi:hypothetical protein